MIFELSTPSWLLVLLGGETCFQNGCVSQIQAGSSPFSFLLQVINEKQSIPLHTHYGLGSTVFPPAPERLEGANYSCPRQAGLLLQVIRSAQTHRPHLLASLLSTASLLKKLKRNQVCKSVFLGASCILLLCYCDPQGLRMPVTCFSPL